MDEKHEQLKKKFAEFYKELEEYFAPLPMDLKQTLSDIEDYVTRNKKVS